MTGDYSKKVTAFRKTPLVKEVNTCHCVSLMGGQDFPLQNMTSESALIRPGIDYLTM